jgi:hypothetical protein
VPNLDDVLLRLALKRSLNPTLHPEFQDETSRALYSQLVATYLKPNARHDDVLGPMPQSRSRVWRTKDVIKMLARTTRGQILHEINPRMPATRLGRSAHRTAATEPVETEVTTSRGSKRPRTEEPITSAPDPPARTRLDLRGPFVEPWHFGVDQRVAMAQLSGFPPGSRLPSSEPHFHTAVAHVAVPQPVVRTLAEEAHLVEPSR